MTRAAWRSRPDPAELLGWLTVGVLIVCILIATYDWRLPNKSGTSFGPVWAGISLVGVGLARVIRGRWEPVIMLAVGTAVASLLTDLAQFNGQLLRDLGIYLRAGEHFTVGAPVYLTTILTEAPLDKTTYPFLYPPPTLPVLALLAALPRPLVELGWLLGSAAAAVAGLRLLGLSTRWALAALFWTPFFQGLYVGNVAVPAFGLFAAAPWFGAGLILAAIFKPYSGLAALWLVRERRFRPIVVGLVALAGLALATLPFVGVDAWRAWIEGLRLYATSQPGLPALVGIGLGAYFLGPLPLIAAVAAVGWAWLARSRAGLARFGVATVVASPSLFAHGFLVALPAFLELRPAMLWLALGITSVAPGLGWWLAVVLVVVASVIPWLRRPAGGPWPVSPGLD
ncbi:MAG: glycosyltransferase 87 family protein [Chloroflexota bacterium]|nr:glycosyltransferase 87 family protein [Chloroflexota bacterium]